MNKDFFLIKCELLANQNLLTQDLMIKFNSLLLKNEDEEDVLITNRDIKYDFYSNGFKTFFNLYIENSASENRIDYLIDEEYEISKLDLSIYSLNDKLNYEHNIVMEYGQISVNFKNQMLASIINAEMPEETVAVIGHRPDRLYGYDLGNAKYQELATLIADACEELIVNNNVKYFLTGGSLGGETIGFFAIEFLKKKYPNIKNIVAIPFEKVFSKWQSTDINRFKRMLDSADGVVEVDLLNYYRVPRVKDGEYNINKMTNKNDFIIDKSDFVVALFDNKLHGNTYNCISRANYLKKEVNLIKFKEDDDCDDLVPF